MTFTNDVCYGMHTQFFSMHLIILSLFLDVSVIDCYLRQYLFIIL